MAIHAEPAQDARDVGRRRRRLVVAMLGGILISVGIWAWFEATAPSAPRKQAGGPRRPETAALSAWQRLVEESPYQNVKLDVKYVDDAACADCHAEIAESFAEHPMGKSLGPTVDVPSIEKFTADAHHPLKVDSLVYQVRRDGNRQFHQETRLSPAGDEALTTEFEAIVAVGSGRTGRSYITQRDGRLFMSPLTWYADHGWDLSPGYETNNSHFNRPVIPECLFCHANSAQHVKGTLNHYESPIFVGYAIGCQRCHGPGELHVRAQQTGTAKEDGDTTIVNPADLALCCASQYVNSATWAGWCVSNRGRQRTDFRPGLPWSAIEAIYFAADQRDSNSKQSIDEKSPDRFVGHVEQMHQSGCFVESGGKLGCISCHDPHRLPDENAKVDFYRQACLKCHGEGNCNLPLPERRERQADDSCFACHMPQAATQIRHAAATDHRIPRAPGKHRPMPVAAGWPEWSPLVEFRPSTGDKETGRQGDKETGRQAEASDFLRDGDEQRNLAIALVMARDRHAEMVDERVLPRAVELLAAGVKRDPEDVAARKAYAFALDARGQMQQALEQMNGVVERRTNDESATVAAAGMVMQTGNWQAAARLWQRARDLNPWIVRYWADLARCQAQLKDWAACTKTCEEAVQRFPDSFAARQLLIECRLVAGKIEEAEQEYQRMLDLNPPRSDNLKRWWQEHPRRSARQGDKETRRQGEKEAVQ